MSKHPLGCFLRLVALCLKGLIDSDWSLIDSLRFVRQKRRRSVSAALAYLMSQYFEKDLNAQGRALAGMIAYLLKVRS
jgi:hypothetical protein